MLTESGSGAVVRIGLFFCEPGGAQQLACVTLAMFGNMNRKADRGDRNAPPTYPTETAERLGAELMQQGLVAGEGCQDFRQ